MKQGKGENVDEFAGRLIAIFNNCSGLELNLQSANLESPEVMLKNFFLEQLRPEISSTVRSQGITHRTCRFSLLLEHAKHAQELQDRKIEQKDEKDELLSHQLMLTMAAQLSSGQKSGPPNDQQDKCFNCNKTGHWSRDCPEPRRKREGGRDRRGGGSHHQQRQDSYQAD